MIGSRPLCERTELAKNLTWSGTPRVGLVSVAAQTGLWQRSTRAPMSTEGYVEGGSKHSRWMHAGGSVERADGRTGGE